jgi:predicted DNA-binding transcriptional regulator YafY
VTSDERTGHSRGNGNAIFGSQRAGKASNDATESVVRKVAMIVELLSHRYIRFGAYQTTYARDYRSFQRDLQQLRKIGVHAGFTISHIKDKEFVELVALDGKTRALNRDAEQVERLTATIARALGEPIVRQLGASGAAGVADDEFFLITAPRLVRGTAVADICDTLREAHSSPGGRAVVRFQYPERGGTTGKEREVEPYRVAIRSGVFYLVGYDRGSKGWRTFALDRFLSKPVKVGTCQTLRSLPPEYASNDAIGFMKSIGTRLDVTVELSAKVARSATARIWQAEQRTESLPGGRARMTFAVSDVSEVVRWAMGFGADACIVAPAEAVAVAGDIARTIAAGYAGAAG